MNNSETEDRELKETIWILLRTTEELKAAIPSLSVGQKEVFRILEEHSKVMISLMDRLIGTKEEHTAMLKKVEPLTRRTAQLEQTVDNHAQLISTLAKTVGKRELSRISSILKRVYEKRPIFIEDLETVQASLSRDPDNQYLLASKATILSRLGPVSEAIEFLDKAISEYSHSPRLWFARGLIIENPDDKLICFDKSLGLIEGQSQTESRSRDLHNVLFSKASVLLKTGRFDEALDSASKSVEMAPDCSNAWLQKGNILQKLNRVPEALGCFERSIEIDKDSASAWFSKGIALSALGLDYIDDAISSFDKAIQLDSKLAEAYFNKGKLLGRKDKNTEALEILRKGCEIDDKYPCAWCEIGVRLNHLKRNKEALEAMQNVLELGPPKGCISFFLNLATVYLYLSNEEKSYEILHDIARNPRKQESLGPTALVVLFNNYAEVLFLRKQYERGVEFARKAVKGDPNSAEAWSTLGANLCGLNVDTEALEAFEKALTLRKDDEEVNWEVLAELYTKSAKPKEAQQALAKSIEQKAKENSK